MEIVRTLLLGVVLLVLAAATRGASAAKFHESFVLNEGERFGPIMEGNMYSVDGGAFVVYNTPYMSVVGKVSLNNDIKQEKAHGVMTALFTYSPTRLRLFDDRTDPSATIQLCKSDGYMTPEALSAFGEYISHETVDVRTTAASAYDFRGMVTKTGYHHVVIVFCRTTGKVGELSASFDAEISFRNPYGFLPAIYYGFLPFYGILAIAYAIILMIFGYLALVHRRSLLWMQVGIFFVVLMGFIETTTWFATYVVMNDTGGAACCPWRPDIVFAIIAQNMKKTVSALLVLTVAMGWGVVIPKLPFRTNILLTCLGLLYLGCLLKLDMLRMERTAHRDQAAQEGKADTSTNDAALLWSLPVAALDLAFLFWIYSSIVNTQRLLAEQHQVSKLDMYRRLSRTLQIWVVLWILQTIFEIGVRSGVIPWPWNLQFLLVGFWDVLYLGILTSIASVWRPSETSALYAYSEQLPTNDTLDEFEAGEFEMTAPPVKTFAQAVKGNAQSAVVHPDKPPKPAKKRQEVNDDEDDDIDFNNAKVDHV